MQFARVVPTALALLIPVASAQLVATQPPGVSFTNTDGTLTCDEGSDRLTLEFSLSGLAEVVGAAGATAQEGFFRMDVYEFDGYPLTQSDLILSTYVPAIVGIIFPEQDESADEPTILAYTTSRGKSEPISTGQLACQTSGNVQLGCRISGVAGSLANESDAADPDGPGVENLYVEVTSVYGDGPFGVGGFMKLYDVVGANRSQAFIYRCRSNRSIEISTRATFLPRLDDSTTEVPISMVVNEKSPAPRTASIPISLTPETATIVGVSSDEVVETFLDMSGDTPAVFLNLPDVCDRQISFTLLVDLGDDAGRSDRQTPETLNFAIDSRSAQVLDDDGTPIFLPSQQFTRQVLEPADEPATINTGSIAISPTPDQENLIAQAVGSAGAVSANGDALTLGLTASVELLIPPALGDLKPRVLGVGSGDIQTDGSFTFPIFPTFPSMAETSFRTDAAVRVRIFDVNGAASTTRVFQLSDFCAAMSIATATATSSTCSTSSRSSTASAKRPGGPLAPATAQTGDCHETKRSAGQQRGVGAPGTLMHSGPNDGARS